MAAIRCWIFRQAELSGPLGHRCASLTPNHAEVVMNPCFHTVCKVFAKAIQHHHPIRTAAARERVGDHQGPEGEDARNSGAQPHEDVGCYQRRSAQLHQNGQCRDQSGGTKLERYAVRDRRPPIERLCKTAAPVGVRQARAGEEPEPRGRKDRVYGGRGVRCGEKAHGLPTVAQSREIHPKGVFRR
jgi:hypothetical protein